MQDELPNLETGSDEADQIGRHFENTVAHIKVRRDGGDAVYAKLAL